MRSCNGIGGNVLKLASTHGPISDLDEVIRNAVSLRMLSFLQDLLDLGPRDKRAQRAARERVKCTVCTLALHPDMLFRGLFIASSPNT